MSDAEVLTQEDEEQYDPRKEEIPDNQLAQALLRRSMEAVEIEEDDEDEEEDGREQGEEDEGQEAEGEGDEEEGGIEGGEDEDEEDDEYEEVEEDDQEEGGDGRDGTHPDAVGRDGKALNKKALLNEKVYKKVDGKIEETTVRQVIADSQRAQGAAMKFQEAAEIKKTHEQEMADLEQNPLGVYYRKMSEKYGHDEAKKMALMHANRIVAAEMEYKSLSPEEQAQRQREAELARTNAALQRKDQETQQLREQLLLKQLVDEVGTAGLPKTQSTFQSIARLYADKMRRGEQTSIKACVSEHKTLEDATFKQRIGSLPRDEIERLLGEQSGTQKKERPGKAMRVKVRKQQKSGRRREPKEKTEKKRGPNRSWEEARLRADELDRQEERQKRKKRRG